MNLPPAQSNPRPSPAADLATARAHLASGRLEEAGAACEALLHATPDDAAGLHLLALVRGRMGHLPDGIRLLERVVALTPGAGAARSDLGAMLIAAGQPERAEPQLAVAVGLQPGSIEARVNLGNALHAQGKLEGAEATYRAALGLDPRHVRGLLSLGNLLVQTRRPDEAALLLATAAGLAPGSAAAHLFLGDALRDLGRHDEALASYGRALAIEPAHPDANENLGCALKGRNQFEAAIRHLRASGKPFARAQALDCELRLGRTGAFFSWLEANAAREAGNLHSASLSAYAAWHCGRPDPHPFCPEPLRYVRVLDRYTAPADAGFLRELIAEAGAVEEVWEPKGVTTTLGFQTGGNLFAKARPGGALERLAADLGAELERYRAGLSPPGIGLVANWPAATVLHGWFVRLVTGGHQAFHNHPYGWMSGCLYLQMPERSPPGEGAIEFSLAGDGFPFLSGRPSPSLTHQPRPGQLALFPSSLFHRTIPFRSDEERLCIAFDLKPA